MTDPMTTIAVREMPSPWHRNGRNFIRFTVARVPEVSASGEVMIHGGMWGFRADMAIGDSQFHVEWYQDSDKGEPEPDARVFIPAVMTLLERARVKIWVS